MSAQLSPVPVAKFFSNDGFPLSFGQLFTYIAGTTTPQATYVDSTQTTQNTNPIQLNFRGECNLWLDPTKSYKFLLQDLFGNTIPGWPIDNITIGNANPSFNVIPTVDNVYTLGSPSFSWANVYVGANHAPVLDTVSGNIGFYTRTIAEISAGVVPINNVYAPGDLRRYGAISAGDITTALANACAQAQQTDGASVYIPAALGIACTVTAGVTLNQTILVYGDGWLTSRINTGNDITIFNLTLNAQKSVFRDFGLFGKGQGSGNIQPAILHTNCNFTRLERIYITAFGVGVRYATGASSCYLCSISNSFIAVNSVKNIDAQAQTNSLTVIDTTFGAAPIGLSIIDSASLNIHGGDCEGCTTAGLDLDSSAGTIKNSHLIAGLHMEGNNTSGGDIRIGLTNVVQGVTIVGTSFSPNGTAGAVNAINCNGLFIRGTMGSTNAFLKKTSLTNEDISLMTAIGNVPDYKANYYKANYGDESAVTHRTPGFFDGNYQDSGSYNLYQIMSGSAQAGKDYYAGIDAIELGNGSAPGAGAKLYARFLYGLNSRPADTTKTGALRAVGDIDLSGGRFALPTDGLSVQTGAMFQGSGVPSNSNGNNGDVYFRTDTPGTANQRIYIKSAGTWTGIV